MNSIPHERACLKCEQTKSAAEFSVVRRRPSSPAALRSYCKLCYNSYQRGRVDLKAEAHRVSVYNKKNPHVSAASMRRHRANDPTGSAKELRIWKNKNPDKVRQHDATKRAKRRAVSGSTVRAISSSEWRQVCDDMGGLCIYCGLGFSELTQDHFFPLALGGNHEVGNIVPACRSCNSRKQHKNPWEFAVSVGRPLIVDDGAKISEAAVQNDILVAVSALPDALFWRNNSGRLPTGGGRWIAFGVPGSPDIIGVFRGRFVGFEVKSGRNKLSESQKNFREAFLRAGGVYVITRSVDDALSILAAL